MKLDIFEQKKAMGQLRKKGDAYRITHSRRPRGSQSGIRITRQWHFNYNYSLCTMDKERPKTHLHLWGFFQCGIQFLACKVNIYTSGTFWCGK